MTTEASVDIAANLDFVRKRVNECCQETGRNPSQVRLVAVSKTKPLELLRAAYDHDQRAFGENYVQELVEKAKAFGDEQKSDVKWHFIGALQSNKASWLVKSVVPFGKLTVETVSSLKLAKKLNTAMKELDEAQKLDIYVQVNTSAEDSKSGVPPEEAPELCQQIVAECDQLQLKGIMTIGAPGDVACLESLASCRVAVANALGMSVVDDLELSMGMSGDFEVAIQKGSTNVRVGSTIFGDRDYSTT
jgi:PLP dependent protein